MSTDDRRLLIGIEYTSPRMNKTALKRLKVVKNSHILSKLLLRIDIKTMSSLKTMK